LSSVIIQLSGIKERVAMTIRQAIREAERRLGEKGSSSPGLDAEILLAFCLGVDRAALFRDMDRPLTPRDLPFFEGLVGRRLRGEPVAYIVGRKEFWSLDFKVGPGVLVPRPETEILVQVVLETAAQIGKASPRILEVGTGSGAISVALARELKSARIVSTDLSPEALKVARENAASHGVADRIFFIACNLLGPFRGAFDMILSNPPYLSESEYEGLTGEIRQFEPKGALVAGPEGTEFHRAMIRHAEGLLDNGGWLFLEIGFGQKDAVHDLIVRSGCYDSIRFTRDYAGIDRVVAVRRRLKEGG
jgi:release factor glutamine methyltransferase